MLTRWQTCRSSASFMIDSGHVVAWPRKVMDSRGVNLHDWIDELCDVLDIDVEVDEALILDLAREAAHNVQRPAAPISTYLLGYAAARSDADPEQLEDLAGRAIDLATRWEKTALELAHEDDDDEADAEVGDLSQDDA